MPAETGTTNRRGYLSGIALKVAWNFLGMAYRWGGDDPLQGFDCSGFVIEVLKSVGLLPRVGDWTAHGLYEMFKDSEVKKPLAGDLVFWFRSDGRAVHVELCIDENFTIGASGGGGTTTTIEDAIQKNAYIKVRPIASRSNRLIAYLDPYKERGLPQ